MNFYYINASSIKRFIYIALITCVAFFIYYYYQNSETYWLVWAILIASFITTGDTFKERIAILCLTGITSVIAIISVYYLTKLTIPLALLMMLITLFCVFIGEQYPKLFFPAFSVNFLAILTLSFSATRIENLERIKFVLLGFLIAGLVQIFFSFHWLRSELRSLTIITLLNLKNINKEIFACLLNIEYIDNIYLFERRLHMAKNTFFQSNEKLEKLVALAALKFMDPITQKIEEIFDLLMDCAQLRRRVTDHTIFDVCKSELQAVENAINEAFRELAKKVYQRNQLDLTKFNEAIDRFDEIYHSVLQVIAKEPVVFFLFIESLKSLSKRFAETEELLDFFWNSPGKSL